MQKSLTVSILAWAAALSPPLPALADGHACNGIDRSLPKRLAQRFEAAARRQFDDPQAEVPQLFRYQSWTIAYVSFTKSDPGYVFYRGDPLRSHYVTIWGGAARGDEEDEIRAWAEQYARGIPTRLAACFAWHLTKDRDM